MLAVCTLQAQRVANQGFYANFTSEQSLSYLDGTLPGLCNKIGPAFVTVTGASCAACVSNKTAQNFLEVSAWQLPQQSSIHAQRNLETAPLDMTRHRCRYNTEESCRHTNALV